MADRDDARPDFNPKHRIVGAIIIVALAVIVVPMVLNERQPPSEIKDMSETSVRGDTAVTKMVVTPVTGVDSETKPAGEIPVKAATPAPTVASAPILTANPVAPVEKLAPAKKSQTVTTEKITKGWIVQVGTFSNTDNAVHLRDKLKSDGHTVQTETITVAGKRAMRLRVGPFHDKDQAARAQAQIRKETGVLGAVQTYP